MIRSIPLESRLGRRLLVQKGPADKQPVSTKQSYSYGGGTNTLFAHEHPELVHTVISFREPPDAVSEH